MRNFPSGKAPGASRFSIRYDRLAHIKKSPRRFLRDEPGFLDQLDIGRGTAVSDRRLICVHLDDRVVDSHGRKSRKNVLDGVHPDRAFADGGGALDRFQVRDVRIDRRLVRPDPCV